jgi:fatty acid amide hydrolase 2
MWMESHNRVYGRSNNPYDPGRIVGGSSGGEGAIIGAGGAPFGLGADVGGSIRMPAFFNGVFGHKPTGGLVPNTGQFPIAANQALRYLCTGPLARRASDLMPLLRILAGPDGQDSGCRALPLGDPAEVKLAGLPVVVVPGNPLVPVGREMRQAQDRAASALAVMGARVSIRRFRDLAWSLPIWAAMLHAAGGPTYKQLMGNGRRVNAWRELLRLFLGNSPYTVPSVGLALLEDLPGALGGGSTRRMLEKGRQLRLQIEEALGPEGVMLYPSYPTPAPRHRRPMLPPWYWVYTAIFNMLEFPVTQVPLGLGREGLPLGVQVVSRAGNDHSTIAVALALERAFGGWVPPPLAG